MTLEICAQTIQSCLNAQKGGAWRVELCQALELGGLTPSSGLIQLAKNYLTIPIHVLIRPRAGDFCYDRRDLEVIRQDIDNCKAMGAEGVVIGVLDEDNEVDARTMGFLVQRAHPLEVTFHRAFDGTPNLTDALESVVDSGCHRILTSGGADFATEGLKNLETLVQKADDRISIMAGSGVTAENIPQLAAIGIREFHMSASSDVTGNEAGPFESNYRESDLHKVKEAKEVLKQLRRNE